MSATALFLVVGTAVVLVLLWVSRRESPDESPGVLAGSEDSPGPSWLGPAMRVLISLVALGASLYIILSKRYDADTSKWAFGTAGTVIGFWLHET
jgi:hypothetical protein